MKKTANKRKTTTLSCDKSTHEFVAAEADRLGLSQREVLARMVDSYRHAKKRSATKAAELQVETVSGMTLQTIDVDVLKEALKEALSKVITKDVNRVIAFQKEQEKLFLTPLIAAVKTIKIQLENLE